MKTKQRPTPKTFTPTFYWLIHHDVLLELTTEPIAIRRRYVHENKPANEVATRLRWMKKVKNVGKIPRAYVDAYRAYADARHAYVDACRAYADARHAYVDAYRAYADACRAYVDAYRAYADARHAYADAYRAYADAGHALDDACYIHLPAIIALHKKECPGCPFDYEKMTLVFPSEKE